jgi:hypothetical protein
MVVAYHACEPCGSPVWHVPPRCPVRPCVFHRAAGNRELALGYVKQLRELDPDNAQYARMAQQIEGAAR